MFRTPKQLRELADTVESLGAGAVEWSMSIPAQPEKPKHLTPPQVAKRYGVSPDTVRSWIERGELRAVNIGNGTKKPRYRIEPDALADFDKRRTPDKTPPQMRPKKKPTGLTVTKFSDRR